jgi:hypothetical protein
VAAGVTGSAAGCSGNQAFADDADRPGPAKGRSLMNTERIPKQIIGKGNWFYKKIVQSESIGYVNNKDLLREFDLAVFDDISEKNFFE